MKTIIAMMEVQSKRLLITAILIVLASVVSQPTASAAPSAPTLLAVLIDRCGQQDFKADTRAGTQIRVDSFTTSALFEVASRNVTWHCNGSNDVTRCPDGTNAARIERGYQRLVRTYCYSIGHEVADALRFGYYRAAAIGTRPLLVILMDLPGPSTAFSQPTTYYDRLVFGPGFPNISDYFTGNSYGAFTWSKAATVGPYSANPSDSEFQRFAGALVYAGQNGVDFDNFDSNQDGLVDNREVGVLIVTDGGQHTGGNRNTDPGCLKPPGTSAYVCLNVATVDSDDFDTIAHELAHAVGTQNGNSAVVDLYNGDCNSWRLTIMSCSTSTQQDTYELDPWHKIQLGWVLPRLRPLTALGPDVYLAAASNYEGYQLDGPVIVWDPNRSTLEYFIFEYRLGKQRNFDSRYEQYDRNIQGEGVVAWLVNTTPDGGLIGSPQLGNLDIAVGAPNASFILNGDSGRPWRPEDGDFSLNWVDGQDSNLHVRVGPLPEDLSGVTISWMLGCAPLSNEVTVYADAGFGGRCRIRHAGDYPNPETIPFSNDSITAVKIGSNVKVTLCEDDNLGGTCETYTADDADLSNNLIGNDTVSSMRVHCDPGANEASFYVDWEYWGSCVYKAIGDYSDPTAIGLPDKTISSVRIGSNIVAILCSATGYAGACEALTKDDNWLGDNGIGNDQVSSLKVIKLTSRVFLPLAASYK